MHKFGICILSLLLLTVHSTFINRVSAEAPVEFEREILPILTDNCFQCHGPDENERQADLRLDTSEGAQLDLGGYAAVVAGHPEKSELIARIDSIDPDSIMPPPDSKLSLSEKERQLLRIWINQGGEYSKHWAFVVPEKPDADTIDELVDHRLEQEGMQRSPLASPEVLCRRLYLDLIGLPPAPAELDEFLASAKLDLDNAIEQLVNQLLSTDAFAEKWARHWLDVARYADSNGFEKDMPREQWAWRDWVIQAIATDMPYNQFVIEQIAGDLIPDRTQNQLIATGFLRNGMVNEEGAIVNEQFRVEGIFDRMDCIGKAVMGLTLQCAQCHSHKFDPLSHDEYFGIFAFLNDTHEAQSWIYSDEQLKQIASIKNQVSNLENQIKTDLPDWREQFTQWRETEQNREAAWENLDSIEHVWNGGLNHPEKLDDRSILVLGHPTTSGSIYITAQPETSHITYLRIEALRYGDLPFGGPGRSYRGVFAISEVEVWSRISDDAEWKPVKLAQATADYAEPRHKLEDFFINRRAGKTKEERLVGPAEFLVDGKLETAWRSDRGPILRETESVALIQFSEPLELSYGRAIKIQLTQNHGGDGGIDNQQLGRFRIGVTGDSDVTVTHDHAATLALEGEQISDELFRAWRQSLPELKEVNTQIAQLESRYPEALTSVLHVAQTSTEHKRQTRLLNRGVWNQPAHVIEPHTPEFLHPLEIQTPTRLDFARWLVDVRNPLAARVQVNRIWQALFGTGLVETSEDFGTRAGKPEHQELLDWLSVDFVEHNWSLKHLLRTIVTSKTYQQSSRLTPDLLEQDPANRLLARGARFRAEAEVVRDIALSTSGLLHQQVGGPSIYPPVPQSLIDYNYFKPEWEVAEAPQRYRRSIYVFRKRSMPDPVLTTFDAPNSDFACARRVRSNTPLAALVSLNEPVFVEASQAMALRVLRESGSGDENRIEYAYRLTTGRLPLQEETDAVLQMLKVNRKRLAEGWLSIDKIGFQNPDSRPELPEGVTPQDVAAWAMVSRVLLNLDETMTRN